MNPCSRSPWAAWFRFMKSMSIVAQGMSRLCCVCRCRSGLRSAFSPLIHILDGENVWHQVIKPDALGCGVGLLAKRRGFLRRLDHRLEYDRRRDGRRAVQRRGDFPGVDRDLLQRIRSVELLAAGDKPDFELLEVNHMV